MARARPSKSDEFDRRSLWWWGQEAETKGSLELAAELYPHMFIEDIRLGLHWYQPPRSGRVSVSLAGGTSADAERLSLALPAARHFSGRSQRSLQEAVCDFVEAIGARMAYYGEAYLEFAYGEPIDEDGHREFELVELPHCRLELEGDVYRQYIPQVVRAKRNLGASYVDIPADRMLTIDMPADVMSSPEYRAMIRRLLVVSTQSLLPLWEQQRLKEGKEPSVFDFARYRSVVKQELARITARFGWNGRGLFQGRATEFYMMVRYVRMLRAMARLREQILCGLNNGLARIASVTGIAGPVRVEGLAGSREAEALERELCAGTAEFREVVRLQRESSGMTED